MTKRLTDAELTFLSEWQRCDEDGMEYYHRAITELRELRVANEQLLPVFDEFFIQAEGLNVLRDEVQQLRAALDLARQVANGVEPDILAGQFGGLGLDTEEPFISIDRLRGDYDKLLSTLERRLQVVRLVLRALRSENAKLRAALADIAAHTGALDEHGRTRRQMMSFDAAIDFPDGDTK